MLQPVTDIAEISARLGIRHFVLSPGSRCAPLTLAVARHPQLKSHVVPDERAAAYIALGMAQALGETVGLICTSGTAAYNYAPAVAEAFYQQVPLLVLTADRPPEWIDQQDGQTLRQQNLYGAHVKASYQLPDSYHHPDLVWHLYRQVNEAINLSQTGAKGPVHVNVPLREPFYPRSEDGWQYQQNLKIIEYLEAEARLPQALWELLAQEWTTYNRKLIVAGQGLWDLGLMVALEQTIRQQRIPLVADIITNLHGVAGRLNKQDSFLMKEENKASLQPDLLLTFGASVISKNLKLFLRNFKPKAHWHLQASGGAVADTFQSLTRVLPVAPAYFFSELNNRNIRATEELPAQKAYYRSWKGLQQQTEAAAEIFFKDASWSEFEAVKMSLEQLPDGAHLHLANSMSVRYANFIGLLPGQKQVQVWANRGTSGIDGCSSTALGGALASKVLTLLITGDMAFIYDRNAFWHSFLPANLRVLVLNNAGGGIFRMIDGPRRQPELEAFFVTRQPFSARSSAEEAGFQYLCCEGRQEFEELLPQFLSVQGGAKLLEVKTDGVANTAVFNLYKQTMQQLPA